VVRADVQKIAVASSPKSLTISAYNVWNGRIRLILSGALAAYLAIPLSHLDHDEPGIPSLSLVTNTSRFPVFPKIPTMSSASGIVEFQGVRVLSTAVLSISSHHRLFATRSDWYDRPRHRLVEWSDHNEKRNPGVLGL
jgi:hypothetical protein